MSRLIFPKGKQREFLIKNRVKLCGAKTGIAKICNVHPRTLFDWEREKFNMSYDSAARLAKATGIPIPKTVSFLVDFWNCSKAGRKGAFVRLAKYGNPGTYERRIRGGNKTIIFFTQNPSFARKCGFIVRKEIKYPQKCAELAELFGVILGDGGLPGHHQITISFNNKTDRKYSRYLQGLLKKLFALDGRIYYRKNNNGADIVANSSNLVDFLLKEGLSSGNKVKNQVGIPVWVLKKPEYEKACVRGLVDTDGSFYRHAYVSGNRHYRYIKLCFTNCSKPILEFVFKTLKKLGYRAYLSGNHVSVYSADEIKKYFKEIGTHNQKHINKLQRYFYN